MGSNVYEKGTGMSSTILVGYSDDTRMTFYDFCYLHNRFAAKGAIARRKQRRGQGARKRRRREARRRQSMLRKANMYSYERRTVRQWATQIGL